ncbi:MAG: shikimate dehydrogenase, partial [Deinococcales bacterium]
IGLYPDESKPDIDENSLQADMLVCDVIPNPPQTAFLKMASARGAQTLDGLGMLVHQGAIAFKMWTEQDAPTEVMKAALRKTFGIS